MSWLNELIYDLNLIDKNYILYKVFDEEKDALLVMLTRVKLIIKKLLNWN